MIGVWNNLNAIAHAYEVLLSPRSTDEAWNLLVYRYRGDGTFELVYDASFRPGSGTSPRQSISRDGDFGDGLLVYERFTWFWSGSYWDEAAAGSDQHVEVIRFDVQPPYSA